jgi:hypothetical protein
VTIIKAAHQNPFLVALNHNCGIQTIIRIIRVLGFKSNGVIGAMEVQKLLAADDLCRDSGVHLINLGLDPSGQLGHSLLLAALLRNRDERKYSLFIPRQNGY